jgi:hypothetical protein
LDISTGASIGDNPFVENAGDGTVNASDPFAPGVREQYELTHGTFMPVSLTSETGRAAFIPINRGIEFFDRYAHSSELNTLSDTTWNDYTVGAIQCAMHIDITDVRGPDDSSPGELTFRYQKNGIEETMVIDLETGPDGSSSGIYLVCR